MLVGNTGLGFNPLKSIARGAGSVASGVVRVARDPRAQGLAVTAARAYAPGQYAQAANVVSQVQHVLRPPMRPGAPMMPMPQQMPMVDPDSGLPPTRDSHLLLYAGIGAGALLLVLLLKR